MKLQIIIVALLSVQVLTVQKVENDLTKENLKGQISSVSESKYSAIVKFGEVEKGKLKSKSISSYDNTGYLIEWIFFDSDGTLISKYSWKNDNYGNIIEQKYYDSNNRVKTTTTSIYEYDEKRNKKKEISYEYDSNDSLSEKLIWIFKYDDREYLCEKMGGISDSLYHLKYIYKYDDNGNMVEEEFSNTSDKNYKDISKFNTDGKRIEMKSFNSEGSLESKHSYKYNIFGDISEDDLLSYTIKGLNAKTQFFYEYDKNGNWIKRIEFFDDALVDIIEREIEYLK